MNDSYDLGSGLKSIPLAKAESCITYKATTRDRNGLNLGESIIMMRIETASGASDWVDADHVCKSVEKFRERLIEKMDDSWIPNKETES